MTAAGRGDGMLDIHGKCRREREELEADLTQVRAELATAVQEWRKYAEYADGLEAEVERLGAQLAEAWQDDPSPVAASGRTSNEDAPDVGATHEPGCEGWHTQDINCATITRIRARVAADIWHCPASGTYHSFGGAEPGDPNMPLAAMCRYGCGRTWGELEAERADSRAGQAVEEVGRG